MANEKNEKEFQLKKTAGQLFRQIKLFKDKKIKDKYGIVCKISRLVKKFESHMQNESFNFKNVGMSLTQFKEIQSQFSNEKENSLLQKGTIRGEKKPQGETRVERGLGKKRNSPVVVKVNRAFTAPQMFTAQKSTSGIH